MQCSVIRDLDVKQLSEQSMWIDVFMSVGVSVHDSKEKTWQGDLFFLVFSLHMGDSVYLHTFCTRCLARPDPSCGTMRGGGESAG